MHLAFSFGIGFYSWSKGVFRNSADKQIKTEPMRLVNHLNEFLEIRVSKYTYENSENQYFSSDALDAKILILKRESRFERELKFMDVEQIELLEKWIILVSTSAKQSQTLRFVDVDLQCMKFTRGNIPYLKVVFSDLYNQWTKPPITWDLIISKKNVHLIRMEIQKTLKKFPCRCGMQHDCHKL